jgi:hypothetical protein
LSTELAHETLRNDISLEWRICLQEINILNWVNRMVHPIPNFTNRSTLRKSIQIYCSWEIEFGNVFILWPTFPISANRDFYPFPEGNSFLLGILAIRSQSNFDAVYFCVITKINFQYLSQHYSLVSQRFTQPILSLINVCISEVSILGTLFTLL